MTQEDRSATVLYSVAVLVRITRMKKDTLPGMYPRIPTRAAAVVVLL